MKRASSGSPTRVAVLVPVGVRVIRRVGVAVALGSSVIGSAVGLSVAVWVGSGVALACSVAVSVGVADGVTVAVGMGVAELSTVAVASSATTRLVGGSEKGCSVGSVDFGAVRSPSAMPIEIGSTMNSTSSAPMINRPRSGTPAFLDGPSRWRSSPRPAAKSADASM